MSMSVDDFFEWISFLVYELHPIPESDKEHTSGSVRMTENKFFIFYYRYHGNYARNLPPNVLPGFLDMENGAFRHCVLEGGLSPNYYDEKVNGDLADDDFGDIIFTGWLYDTVMLMSSEEIENFIEGISPHFPVAAQKWQLMSETKKVSNQAAATVRRI